VVETHKFESAMKRPARSKQREKRKDKKKIRFLAKGATPSSYPGTLELGGLDGPGLCLGKSIELNLTEQEVKLVDIVELNGAMKALLEFQSWSMIMSRMVATLLQGELVGGEQKKKFVEELATLKKKVEANKSKWAIEKNFEEEVKKVKGWRVPLRRS